MLVARGYIIIRTEVTRVGLESCELFAELVAQYDRRIADLRRRKPPVERASR